MKIVVCVKQVPDTAAERKLRPADSTLDRESVDGLINELDEYAIEEGLLIAEAQRAAGHDAEVTILTMGLLGYGCGLGNHRNIGATATVCLLISLVILTIMDLDRPRRGLITISQKPMLELRDSMR